MRRNILNKGQLGQTFVEGISEVVCKAFNFTLTKGYDSTNTCFVNIETCETMGANPIKNKAISQWDGKPVNTSVHISGEGYLYRCYKRNMVATTKGGFQGFTYPMEISPNKWVVFQCFNKDGNRLEKAEEINIEMDATDVMLIYKNKTADKKFIGTFIHEGNFVNVYAERINGLRPLLKMLFNISGALYQHGIKHPEITGQTLEDNSYWLSSGHIVKPWGQVFDTVLTIEEAKEASYKKLGYEQVLLTDCVIVDQGITTALLLKSDNNLLMYQGNNWYKKNDPVLYEQYQEVPLQEDGRFYHPHLMTDGTYYGATTEDNKLWHDHHYKTGTKTTVLAWVKM